MANRIPQMSFRERLATFADRPGECWPWPGSTDDGYGRCVVDGRALKAHRAAYEILVGPIPSGLVIDHLCRNRRCMNPAHMEPVSHAVNCLRGEGLPAKNARKTHCVHGHELAGENVTVDAKGRRKCRTCERARKQRQWPRMREWRREWRRQRREQGKRVV